MTTHIHIYLYIYTHKQSQLETYFGFVGLVLRESFKTSLDVGDIKEM